MERGTLKQIDAEALHRWFGAKGQRHVVLDLAYVRKIPPAYREGLLEIAHRCIAPGWDAEAIHDMESHGPDNCLQAFANNAGYLLLPVDKLCAGEFSAAELAVLQEIVELYKDERLLTGVTAKEEACECGGEPGCSMCEGKGVVVILDEMKEAERMLASEMHDDSVFGGAGGPPWPED